MALSEVEGHPYEVLASKYRDKIRRGELQPGDKMPTQRQLMEEEGRPAATVQRALAKLEEEGWIKAIPGRGSFVLDRQDQEEPDLAEQVREMRGQLAALAERVATLEQDR
ncbi:winged helix-turn-helix domain-containing protein [Lentzea sp. NPDC005914]|uniref:winged helix-turn-helix domain-containing protein n=1 Tax=Lentzea sp. NPDC005914 TaxID=3154572 RepID=UPI0033F75D26